MQKSEPCHPKSLYSLMVAGMCMHFAFWGIGNLLVYTLIDSYNFTNHDALQVYGFYTGGAFVLAIIGGYISDIWNYHGPIIISFILGAIGCFFLTLGTISFLYLGLICLTVCYGIYLPASYSLLGYLYRHYSFLREMGFTTYYGTLNLGAFIGTLSLGSFGYFLGWTKIYYLAGVILLLGIIAMWLFVKTHYLTSYAIHPRYAEEQEPKIEENRKTNNHIIFILCFFSVFFWVAYAQSRSSIAIVIKIFMDRQIGDFIIPAGWLISLQSLLVMLFALLMAFIYNKLLKKNCDLPGPIKTALGLIILSLAFVVLTIAFTQEPLFINRMNVFYVLCVYSFISIAELLVAPIGLSLLTQVSTDRYIASLVGVWCVCVGFSFFLGGYLAGLMNRYISMPTFFGIFILIPLIAGIVLWLLSPHMKRIKKQ
jgi:POT family proton-dependent oligopeptide transporter